MSAIVLIGPTDALARLREQFPAEGKVQTFSDHEIRAAVEYIATHRPPIVAIEESFAVSPRGEALIGRIMDDPALQACEIRVLPGPTPAPPVRKSGTGITPAPPRAESTPPALDHRGTRRAVRIRMADHVEVAVDGNPAELVDISPLGAQVVSRMVLRPNQRVRLSLPEEKKVVRCLGSVVWASFEMPPGQPPRYRAGLRLSGVEVDAVERFADRHRAEVSAAPTSSGEPG